MADEAENAVYALEAELRKILAFKSDTNMVSVFSELGKVRGYTGPRYLINLMKLFDDALEVVAHLSLPEQRVSQLISTIVKVQEAAMSLGSRNVQEFTAKIGAQTPTLLSSIGDTVAAVNLDKLTKVDRDEFSERTSDLIKSVEHTAMPEIAKKALLLKLIAIRRIVQEVGVYSDEDIRRRVKSVVADFNSEFSKADSACDSIGEKIWKWAMAVSRPGIFALALTADTSSVIALLPKP